MKSSKSIFAFLLFTICFYMCKKYPEDDSRYGGCSPKCRLVGKNGSRFWEVQSFLVNGEDSTGLYCYPTLPYLTGCRGYQFGRKESGGAYSIGSASAQSGKWGFTNHKKNIRIETGTGGKPLFLAPDFLEWKIEKLEGGEFWIKTNYNNKEYYLKLKS